MTAPALQPTAHLHVVPARGARPAARDGRPFGPRIALGVLVCGLVTCAVGYAASAVAVAMVLVRALA